jgi:hypothetical protein
MIMGSFGRYRSKLPMIMMSALWPGSAGVAVIRRFAASHTVILITHDPRLTAAADTVLRLASRQPWEQARDWPCVPSPLAEVSARSVLT